MKQQGTPFKAAVIGCGRIGTITGDVVRKRLPRGWVPLSHADAIVACEGVDLVALCDLDPERVARAASTYGVEGRYTDYRAMIAEVRPDIVTIATRTEGRADIVVDAAVRGVRGMHIEKPMARSMAECNRAIDALKTHGVHMTYGTTRRHMEIYLQAKAMVEAGEIGDLEEVVVEIGHTLLLWDHPHSTDMLLYFADTTQVDSVQATCRFERVSEDRMLVDDDPVIDNAFYRFGNGVRGLITVGRGMNIRMTGSKGQLTVYADGSGIEVLTDRKGNSPYLLDRTDLTSTAVESGTQVAIAEIRDAILIGPRGSTIRFKEVQTGLRMLLGAVWSSMHGGCIAGLDEVPEEFTVTGRFGNLYA